MRHGHQLAGLRTAEPACRRAARFVGAPQRGLDHAVHVHRPQQALAEVRVGQKARLTTDTFGDRTWEGEISIVNPEVDVATRNVRIRATFPNPDGLLRPGMFAHVDVLTGGDTPRLSAPDSAIIDDGQRRIVLVAEGEGRFRPQLVKTGLRSRDHVEILSGLEAGDRVVTSGQFLIDSESNLRASFQRLSEPDAEPAGRHP